METVKAWFINHRLPLCERFKNRLEELGAELLEDLKVLDN
eukprot:CAMPEP_0113537736 /NCGR_PEP_ID=MMETSP0015_2-20120614/6988_1 /TAXON_ID=2838 /ORGANISM="Odontella" /LENGTH=39 /DNA_ID=CAMNT_0000437257 /DNA_START=808 /DNA_END=927 /DNA_ORIENTATION=+ /assembly_acc=CAM_ASM_000160